MLTKIKITNGADEENNSPPAKKVVKMDSIRPTGALKIEQKQEPAPKEEPVNFSNHKLPSEEQVRQTIQEEIHEAKSEEIEESLSEIYHDEKGNMVDVRHLYIKKKKGALFYGLSFLILLFLGFAGYWGFGKYKYLLVGSNAENISLKVESKSQVIAGEEFLYTINYTNNEKVGIRDIEIGAILPEKFLMLDSVPYPTLSSTSQNAVWKVDHLDAGQSGKIEIKGKLIMPATESGVIFVDMTYRPDNYSTTFKKSTSMETQVTDVGLDITFDNYSSVLVGEENEITVMYKAKETNFLNNFRISMNSLENLVFIPNSPTDMPGTWLVATTSSEVQQIKLKFKFKEKINPTEELSIRFESNQNENYYLFLDKKISIEVMKSTLNLNMIINGSRSDQGIDFGQTMNYSVVFANKGEVAMKNLVIMAVLDGELVDWSTFKDQNNGKIKNNTITWTKNELPILSELGSGQEGTIDFSINVVSQDNLKNKQANEIKNFAQFNIGGFASTTPEEAKKQVEENKDTKSNVIVCKLNSDVDLSEMIRYFNDDNIAVGSGPIPPKVGQTTSYKVYWKLTNSLHELSGLSIETTLPEYVKFDEKSNVSVGSIRYEAETRKVIWNIGRLPVSEYKVEGDFNIAVTPTDEYYDKIMVLLSGSTIKAIDIETSSEINKTTKPKTTQLESDEVAKDLNSDGRVVR